MKSPVFIIGPGRCGTTTLAQWLLDHGYDIGIEQGLNLEDQRLLELNSARVAGHLTIERWRTEIMAHVSRRREPWGMKVCNVCDLLGDYMALFPRATWIRSVRPYRETLDSWLRVWGLGAEKSARLIRKRETALNALLPHAHCIAFAQIVDGTYRSRMAEIVEWQSPTSD